MKPAESATIKPAKAEAPQLEDDDDFEDPSDDEVRCLECCTPLFCLTLNDRWICFLPLFLFVISYNSSGWKWSKL